jgi:hypothetical protein
VESIIELFSYILLITVFCGILVLSTKFVKFRKTDNVKSAILNLKAQLSQLRLALKGKIKKKARILRASLKTPVAEGDPIDMTLKQLADSPFETSEDFQTYFDLSRTIVNLIVVENNGSEDSKINIENDFMCSDLKTEMDIIRIIKAMTDLSSKINVRIEECNRITPNQPMAKVDSLIFASMVEINRIFKNEGDSAAFQKPDPDNELDKKVS